MAKRDVRQKCASWPIRCRIQTLCGADSREEGVRGAGGEGLSCLQIRPPRPLTIHTCIRTQAFILRARGGEGEEKEGRRELKCNLFMFPRCNTPHFPCWVKTKTLYNLFLELVSSCQEEHVN